MAKFYQYLVAGLLLIVLPQTLFSQVLSGSLYQGQKAKALPGVIVTIEGSSHSARSDRNGRFLIEKLPIGESVLTLRKEGFVTRTVVITSEEGRDTISGGFSMCPIATSYDKKQQEVAWRRVRQNQKTPQAVASLDASQIRELPARTLPELILGTPGAAILQQDYASASPQIRGLGGRNILLLQDGIPVLPVTLGASASPWWLTVDPSQIYRAEILRGSASVGYGNNAAAGVVALSTFPSAFSDGKWQVHGNIAGRYQPGQTEMGGNGRLSISGPFLSADISAYRRNLGPMPLSAQSNALPPQGYQTEGNKATLGFQLGSHHKLEIGWDQGAVFLDSARFQNQGEYSSLDRSVERDQIFARWTANYKDPLWNLVKITVARQDFNTERSIQYQGSDPVIKEEETLHSFRAMVEIHSKPNWLWQAVSGVEVARHDLVSSAWQNPPDGNQNPITPSLPNGASQEEVGIYSLHTLDVLKLRLAFGGRAQAQRVFWEDTGTGAQTWAPQALVGNVSAMFPLSQQVEITSSFRSGFRAPGLSDLRFGVSEAGMVMVPSDSLGTERTFSSEIGLKAHNKRFSGSLVLYHTQLNDWIRHVSTTYMGSPTWQGAPVIMARNLDQAFVQGVEAEMEIPMTKITALYGSFTYTYGLNVSQSDYLTAMPPINSRLGLRVTPISGLWSRLEWRHASQQNQLSAQELINPTQDPEGSPGWNVFHLHLGYDFAWGYAMLGVENMFDTRYVYHGSAIESSGRLLIFSLQLGF